MRLRIATSGQCFLVYPSSELFILSLSIQQPYRVRCRHLLLRLHRREPHLHLCPTAVSIDIITVGAAADSVVVRVPIFPIAVIVVPSISLSLLGTRRGPSFA